LQAARHTTAARIRAANFIVFFAYDKGKGIGVAF
jgi:hypothetical protein